MIFDVVFQLGHKRNQDFGGAMTVGLVIDPRCVDGFDLAAFNVPDQAGG